MTHLKNHIRTLESAGVWFILIAVLVTPPQIWGHGVVGDRFFPTTLVIRDPVVNDEFTTLFEHRKIQGRILQSDLSWEFSKRITPHIALNIEGQYQHLDVSGQNELKGFDNLGIGGKITLLERAAREFVVTTGIEAELGGTGSDEIGAEPFSVVAPGLFMGKGFGDLHHPQLAFFRPLALTAEVSAEVPTRETEPDFLVTGFSVQYPFAYLHQEAPYLNLPPMVNTLLPLIEGRFETCLNKQCEGEMTGTINPGVMWIQRGFGQISLEAAIPVNKRTGSHVGINFQVHLFLDEIFPNSLGAPIFFTGIFEHRH